jgi:dihydrofolate reductase
MKKNTPTIAAIVAMSENRVIGHDNHLPWYLPADLKHFKTLTTGHPILMGRKTYESIGRPLPNRTNIIITGNSAFKAPGCVIIHSMDEAIEYAISSGNDTIFIIGGANVYQQCLPYVSRIHLTVVHHTFVGDAFFPEINLNEWKEITSDTHKADENNEYSYTFSVLERISH